MKIRNNILFTEPGYDLNISHKMMNKLNDMLNNSDIQNIQFKDNTLKIFINSIPDITKTVVDGPISLDNNIIAYQINLPYKMIKGRQKSEVAGFITYYFEGLKKLFHSLNLNHESLLNDLFLETNNVIVGNREYEENNDDDVLGWFRESGIIPPRK